MSAIAVAAVISGAGFMFSVLVSAFISGNRWGTMARDVAELTRTRPELATKGDLATMNERMARIEGMFELRLRDDRAA